MTLLTTVGDPAPGAATWTVDPAGFDDGDYATAAMLLAPIVSPFRAVEAVPDGGERLAAALEPYAVDHGPLIIADTVCAGPGRLAAQLGGRDPSDVVGAVIFDAGGLPVWCRALFTGHSTIRIE